MDNEIEFKNLNLTIIGVGLMGGSILKALKSQNNRPKSIIAFDIDKDVLTKVKSKGLADIVTDDAKIALKDADLIVIALYPKLAIEFVKHNADNFKKGSIITDICGVKREIEQGIPDVLPKDVFFVGGHPMAGREHKGFAYSTPDLFLGCKYIITSGEEKPKQAVKEFADIIGAAKIIMATSETHDELIAYTSQLPHVLSVAYMLCADRRNVEDFSAGSFRDVTRVAMINDEMWSELFLENKDKLLDEIRSLKSGLADLENLIDKGQRDKLRDKMRKAALMREGIKG